MPKLLKIVFKFKFHPLHAKISTPTGTAVPVEKVKEISSTNNNSPKFQIHVEVYFIRNATLPCLPD